MSIFIVAAGVFLVIIVALALSRGGAGEPLTSAHQAGIRVSSPPTSTLKERTEHQIRALGLRLVRTEEDDPTAPSFIASSGVGPNEQRVYVRAFERPSAEPVNEPEVVSALDYARAEGFNKALLISRDGFSDEAILAARDTIAVLIDSGR